DVLQLFNRFTRRGQVMTPALAAYIAAQVAAGLDYAHRKTDADGRPLGIVHRDVSPQNVLISHEGDVKLIDFGIARAFRRSASTREGVLKGKFAYMSPEQVRGLPYDRRSDVFAVGTLLYELATGRRLFAGDSDFESLEKVRNADVPAPRTVRPSVPEALERVILRALAKDPEQRFQWASEMAAELDAFLAARDRPVARAH